MIRGYYTALSEIVTAMSRMNAVSDNVANVNTPGFKQVLSTQQGYGFDIAVFLGLDGQGAGIGELPTATYADEFVIDRSQGSLETTMPRTDLAIEGDGLFAIRTASGIAYTRAGNFVIDAQGTLTTQLGQPVLDVDGRAITIPGGAAAFTVNPDGAIDGTGQRMALVAFPASGVRRLGDNLYAIDGPVTPVAPPDGNIRQGFLERSNTDLALGMVDLIGLQRGFQLASRALVLQDETLQTAIQAGRLRT